VHTVYVAPLGEGSVADAFRKRLMERLKKTSNVRVVDDANAAEAVLRGSAVIWQTGTVSVNPRSNGAVVKNYQGYLSAELTDASHRALWSYLATPSRFHMSNIVDDLADQLDTKLVEAIAGGAIGSTAMPKAKTGSGVALRVAGATFPAPLYQLWFRSFADAPDGFPLTYDAVGSVAGFQALVDGRVDMAASDIPSLRDTPGAPKDLLQVPAVVGGVVPIYNLSGVTDGLQLTAPVLADIFSGKIHRWNDPAIRQWNKDARLPDAEIAVVHRSDGSGTTFVWTKYLAQASPEWKARTGAAVAWPTGTGVAGNDGVAEAVATTPNSIAYTELTFAIQHQLAYAAIRNPAGKFVKADLASITAAVAAHVHTGEDDLRFSALNSAAKGAYPVTTFTWLLVPRAGIDPQKREEAASFLRWMLTTGQKECSALGYAPLPADVVREELAEVDELK
jgi:phosphate ABC transporter phosphate-binding protein